MELDAKVHQEIQRLSEEGDTLASQDKYDDAIEVYRKALSLVPEPHNQWEAATWLLAAIADAAYLSGDMPSARQALDEAMTCPGAVGNPFLHLRRGEVLFEQNELDASADELIRAYGIAGNKIFESEPKKYIDFLGTRAKSVKKSPFSFLRKK